MATYNEKINVLEKEELELHSADVNLYIKLMAYYLVQHKLFDAKYLWSRIPEGMKIENIELQILNKLEKSLVSNNYADVFKNINIIEWNGEIKSVMQDLKVIAMENTFQLIGSAYTSIIYAALAELTNLQADQIKNKCAELDWILQSYDHQLVIHPKKSASTGNAKADSEYQLSKLTEFVSFLEN